MEELAQPAAVVAPRPRPWIVFASGPFRKLWAATTLSLFGDFFSYIALAWLVLQLTGSSLALGTVLVVVPGLASSVIGALLLLPPTRAAARPHRAPVPPGHHRPRRRGPLHQERLQGL